MKTSELVCILGLALITGSGLVFVHGKRQQPRHDEIERVINDTDSVICKCSNRECSPGSGLNVQCGTSIPYSTPIQCVGCVKGVNYSSTQDYSTCKSCRNCGKHENKRGECTPEEDKTKCLGTCHMGFYMDTITGDCHLCSDCCNIVIAKKHHEKQCEDSGLPPEQQCRQSNIKCPRPTKPDNEQGRQGALTIALIFIAIFLIILLIVFLVLLRHYGWEQVKSFLTKFCCCCCQLVLPMGGITINFDVSDQFFEGDLEAAPCNVSGSHVTEGCDVLTTLSSLPGKIVKRPMFQRLHSVPVETQSKLKMPRSFSHPGALKDLAKFDKVKETLDFKSGLKKPGARKHAKKGYTLVETEPPMIDDLLAEKVDRERFLTPISSDEFLRVSLEADDFMAQEPGKETPAPTELPEIDDLPVQNHGKNCEIKPTSSGAVPGHCLQSTGSMVKDPGKERLEKPSATDQCTSTTELHLSSATKVADIPQDFLNYHLSKRMSVIPIQFYRKICIKLDTLRELLWDDYRLLAEKVGLDKDTILLLGQQKNQTEIILQKFDAQRDCSIGRFKAILVEMERNDVETVIEEWLLYEWNKEQNNNSSLANCGRGPNYKLQSLV